MDKKIVSSGHSLGGAIQTELVNNIENISTIVFDPASNNTETDNIGSRMVKIIPKGGGILKLPNKVINSFKNITEINEKNPLYIYDDSTLEYVIKKEMEKIEEINKEKIVYENSTNQMIENKKIYDDMYNRFKNQYLKKEAIEMFEETMRYPSSYKNYKAGIIIKNIDEILKDNHKKNKEKIKDELLNMLEMKQGILRKHNSGKLDDKFKDLFIKPNEYERIGK